MVRASEGLAGIGNAMNGLFKKELARLKTPGHEEERQLVAELGLKVAEQQRLTESSTLMTDLVAVGLRTRFLQEMAPDTEIGTTGRTAAQELELTLAEKAKMGQFLKRSDSAHAFLQQAPIEIQSQYADRVMMDGEAAALKFLVTEMEKPKP